MVYSCLLMELSGLTLYSVLWSHCAIGNDNIWLFTKGAELFFTMLEANRVMLILSVTNYC